MEEGMLWRADVMEGPCAVARGKDNISRGKGVGLGSKSLTFFWPVPCVIQCSRAFQCYVRYLY
jgi:hypothetical protein